MIITSKQNSRVLQIIKLADKKHRKSLGQYVIEGERLVCDAATHGADIIELFVAQSKAARLNIDIDNPSCVALFASIKNEPTVYIVADDVFEKMSDTVSSQGILAVARFPEQVQGKPTGNCLVMDCIQDPGNAGTLIRTAAACGFTDVVAAGCVDVYSSKVLRSAMSAHFCVNVRRTDTIEEAFALLDGMDIVAADMHGENIVAADFDRSVALIVGNEGNGISDYSRSHSDRILSLPMQNSFESLNAGVAGSVMMYQIFFNQTKFIK